MTSKESAIESRLGDQLATVDATRGWSQWIESKSIHAPSLALRLWQQWHTRGPRKMGETTYLGTTRVMSSDRFMDMTKVTTGEVEAYFYTDPKDHRIVEIEIEINDQLDRLEVTFEDYRQQGKVFVPSKFRAGFGTDIQYAVDLEPVEFVPASGVEQ